MKWQRITFSAKLTCMRPSSKVKIIIWRLKSRKSHFPKPHYTTPTSWAWSASSHTCHLSIIELTQLGLWKDPQRCLKQFLSPFWCPQICSRYLSNYFITSTRHVLGKKKLSQNRQIWRLKQSCRKWSIRKSPDNPRTGRRAPWEIDIWIWRWTRPKICRTCIHRYRFLYNLLTSWTLLIILLSMNRKTLPRKYLFVQTQAIIRKRLILWTLAVTHTMIATKATIQHMT